MVRWFDDKGYREDRPLDPPIDTDRIAEAMYEAYFHLRARPFSTTPDASCFYASESLQESLDELVLRTQSGHGIGILTGSAGTGKTLLCLRLIAELGGTWTGIVLPNTNLPTRKALYQAILFELGQAYQGMDEQELRLAFVAWLRANAKQARRAILILDEAHLLPDRLLEEIRGLSDLSEAGKPMLQVVVSGNVTLDERLTNPDLTALNQRVACHVVLEPLDQQQTLEYITHRVTWSGGEVSRMFDAEALLLIARLSNGIPRCINHLCDHCLLLTYVNELEQVTRPIVLDAIADLRQLPLPWNEPFHSESRTATDHEVDRQPLENEVRSDENVPAPAIELGAAGLSGTVTSIEIGGSPAESQSSSDRQPASSGGSPSEELDQPFGIQDDESFTNEMPAEEDIPVQPAVGFGIVPLMELPTSRAVEPATPDQGIAFDIARAPRTQFKPSSGVSPTPVPPPKERSRKIEPLTEVRAVAVSEFTEERIIDRYAALDAGWPVPPAAEDVHQPPNDLGFSDPLERWNAPPAWSPGIVPLMPEALSAGQTASPDAVSAGGEEEIINCDHVGSAIDRESIERAAEDVSRESFPSAGSQTTNDSGSDDEDLEEQIGNAVLDLCLETQQAIQQRFEESQLETRWSSDHDLDDDTYDVVHPESPATRSESDLERHHPQKTGHDQQSGRQTNDRTSEAGLKRLFSTLRKRQK